MRRNEKMKKGKVPLYNIALKDFKIPYDLSGDNPRSFFVPAQEITWWKPWEKEFIKKYIGNYMLNKRGIKNNPEMDLKEIYADMEPDL